MCEGDAATSASSDEVSGSRALSREKPPSPLLALGSTVAFGKREMILRSGGKSS